MEGRTKLEMVSIFGGCCQYCGYKKSTRALQFHHCDSSEKKDYSGNYGYASRSEIIKHPDRFKLLCANCHFEEHERIDEEKQAKNHCRCCGAVFRTQKGLIDKGRDIYCSRKCHAIQRRIESIDSEPSRFWGYAIKGDCQDDCWGWSGNLTNKMAVMHIIRGQKPTMISAHRYSYEIHFGEVPEGRNVTRTCKSRVCANPGHLTIKTPKEMIASQPRDPSNMRLFRDA